MRIFSYLLLGTLTALTFNTAAAENIDTGRGPIPLHVPAEYDKANPTPLVILLHGYTSTGSRQNAYMKFGKLADSYGYLFVAPDGTHENSKRKPQFWNATEACCNFLKSDVDDSAYIRSLIDQIKSKYNVDPSRVFLIGHSNGGFMSYRMAYDHPETIAAIASLAGASFSDLDRPAPSNPVHVLQIHGTEDETISYEGGKIGNSTYPSAKQSVEKWATYNGCVVEATRSGKTLDLDKRLEGAETIVTKYTSDCNPGGAAELWTIEGGKHIPNLSANFGKLVIEWLFAHPKTKMVLTD